jgi:membrane fusion protein YbhG
MHHVKRILIVILVAVAVGALIWMCVHFFRTKVKPNELELYGNVDVRQVDIGFRVAGIVDDLHFEEGDFVSTGTLLATLDKSPYDSQVREAVATMESVKAAYENAEILLKRRQELIGVGGVSQEDLDNAMAAQKEQLANLLQAKAALTVALDNLTYTEAYAPTDGTILTRIREPGTVVNPAEAVYTISVASPVWVRAYVSEPNLGKIYYGQKAEVITDTPGAKAYTGQIGFISPVAEFTPKTVETTQLRTDLVYRLRIYVDNPDRLLKQGMPVTVKLDLTTGKAQ